MRRLPPTFLASISGTLIMLLGEAYLYWLHGYGLGWLLYLFIVWPALAVYWMRELWRYIILGEPQPNHQSKSS